jgi:hypothetical protein
VLAKKEDEPVIKVEREDGDVMDEILYAVRGMEKRLSKVELGIDPGGRRGFRKSNFVPQRLLTDLKFYSREDLESKQIGIIQKFIDNKSSKNNEYLETTDSEKNACVNKPNSIYGRRKQPYFNGFSLIMSNMKQKN